MRVMVDTNVLARYADPDSGQHADAVGALRAIQAAGHLPVLNAQVKREFLDIAERPTGAGPGRNGLGLTAAQARELMASFRSLFGYLGEQSAADERFDQLHAVHGGGKTVHDLNIVASMLSHGVTSIVTFNDKHFRRFESDGIAVRTPREWIADEIREAQE